MIPSKMFDILDLAKRVTDQGRTFNVLFQGPAGVGKSEIVQQWCRANTLRFIDLRAAYLESPDLIGYPTVETIDGRQVTKHNVPEFWPHPGESPGVLFIDEVNRGTNAVMNCFMQLLTDKRIHNYEFPQNWMIVAAINPENGEYEVNTMDAALKSRFELFEVNYDRESFVTYMKDSAWDERIVMFVESGSWTYTTPEEVAKNPQAKYVSPRNWSKVNNALKAGFKEEDSLMIFEALLGKNIGKMFLAFLNDERPVLRADLESSKAKSLKRLKKFSDPQNYKNHLTAITVKDITDRDSAEDAIEDDLLADVLLTIPADQAVRLIRDLEYKRKVPMIEELIKSYPELKKYLQTTFRAKA